MTKKDYERAARIVQGCPVNLYTTQEMHLVTEAFVKFFAGDNLRFDIARFRQACLPGANVKARPRKSAIL